ncbi:cobyrinate a,c-diamide synthase [Coraliomargarita algicola]|uniref:Cobyrinate a,c-diamide synthase n=1 Tax=Coraliomargarita algicola TaxID=3092156 RepID=A0ABZ0RF36_9BACT|nr:cobyrinate a,c-diamide synthase [Coraliomargarita sp. J2-16]WPJ94622.1 cobyrinate a,c-diamide synthase [Coraliomargarita sp. J2-16]
MGQPRHSFCIAGTQSGSGKTTLTLGLMAALRQRGLTVQPFKCGPDYIDAGHHRHAAGRISRNLDSWMMPPASIPATFQNACAGADVAVCEGVMGLFDGASSTELKGSTAEIALLTDMPVVLVVDARAMARSIAALVAGYVHFEKDLRVCGIIANRVGSEGHARILREALAAAGLPPLLGCLPRDEAFHMPERHLGLVADTEDAGVADRIETLATAVESAVDIDQLLECSRNLNTKKQAEVARSTVPVKLRMGLARDAAFYFYYEDNLDALRARGVELVEFSPLNDAALPEDLDGLYIGGGFPEQFSAELSSNIAMHAALRAFAESGRPIFAECGGYMYLCRSLELPDGNRLPMAGVLAADCVMRDKRQRLGYTKARSLQAGIFGSAGTNLRGHEFHWSEVVPDPGQTALFEVSDAHGRRQEQVGIQQGNTHASYFHPHFASNPAAVDAWVTALESD